ncbi:uncharacterized protein LOC126095580 [Schistocerca cancellata]|uniref:uncharacterized protein LOC126095580 n=1 Tax=Schistocerca cancellata TaxID=274614 RepID=UPI00211824DC|nr:uncharacterized protein LOC126095580 [Schistocerca cancellata]
MKSKCFRDLSKDLWLASAERFHKRANFPHCVGAVNGKHIRIVKPTSSGSLYYNYKNYFSILLLAVCDSTYKFLFIDVGAYGKSSDSIVFRNTVLNNKLQDGTLDLPAPKQLSLSFERPTPFMLVGDEGFGMSKFILRPYGGKYLDIKKRVFNYRLCRARRYIECTFGILANKWRIFYRPLDVKLDVAESIVKTCCLLHNFVRDRDGIQFEDTVTIQGLQDMSPCLVRGGNIANGIREDFAYYFISPEGEVPWQLQKICVYLIEQNPSTSTVLIRVSKTCGQAPETHSHSHVTSGPGSPRLHSVLVLTSWCLAETPLHDSLSPV